MLQGDGKSPQASMTELSLLEDPFCEQLEVLCLTANTFRTTSTISYLIIHLFCFCMHTFHFACMFRQRQSLVSALHLALVA